MSDETIPGELQALRESVDSRFNEGHRRMGAIEATQNTTNSKLDTLIDAMAENTAITNIVKDGLTAGRVMRKVLIWFAGIAGAVGTIWGAIEAFTHR